MVGITNPAEVYFKDGVWTWNGTAWVKAGGLGSSFEAYTEDVIDPTANTGLNILAGTTVPTGEIWEVTRMIAWDFNNAPGTIVLEVVHDGTIHTVDYYAGPAAYVAIKWDGHAWLDVGDNVQARFLSCTLNDSIYLYIFGRKFKVSE